MRPASEHPNDTGFGDGTLGADPKLEGPVTVVIGVAAIHRGRRHPEGARLQGEFGDREVQ